MEQGNVITVIKPGFELITPREWFPEMLKIIEKAGRTCYKSEHRIHSDSAEEFVHRIVKSGHDSVIEHCVITVKIICSRACSHQLVRHRIAAYSQESQRYCDYGKSGLQVICPPEMADFNLPTTWERQTSETGEVRWGHLNLCRLTALTKESTEELGDLGRFLFLEDIYQAYQGYLVQRERGAKPQDARFLLPNATKTEVVTTFNLRQWRHVFKERALNPHAQWEIRGIMLAIMKEFIELLPVIFTI